MLKSASFEPHSVQGEIADGFAAYRTFFQMLDKLAEIMILLRRRVIAIRNAGPGRPVLGGAGEKEFLID
jgi:hypothetical protein